MDGIHLKLDGRLDLSKGLATDRQPGELTKVFRENCGLTNAIMVSMGANKGLTPKLIDCNTQSPPSGVTLKDLAIENEALKRTHTLFKPAGR